ncbi:MAG: LysR family transcriptional regulator [Phenylobacterium zucineum]|nr:MAG: LysR family transcriptional regulator [Phenylobacterium zucineum]
MNFRQLEIFRAVMVSGSASRAADLLQITQPAVSRAVGELEGALGFLLFDRVRGRLVPTAEGRLFFRDVSLSFVGLDSLRASAARIRDFGSGSIRIASLAAMGSTLVPRAIRTFRDALPQIAITLQIHSSSMVRDLVANQQFDLGLAADEVDLSGVDHRPFSNSKAVCAIPPGHPLGQKTAVRPMDLDGLPFVALAPEDRARGRMMQALDAAGSKPEIVVETPASATVCALALEGVGVGLVNPVAAIGFAERGLVFRPFEPDVYFTTYLLFRPDAQRAQIVSRFVAELMAARSLTSLQTPAKPV